MGQTRLLIERYGTLGLLLVAIAAASATIVASCGSGGGSSDGALCQQCGDTDGPCQDNAFIFPRPADGVIDAQPCPTPSSGLGSCIEVGLICRRKSDSSQQRCFPRSATDPTNPDFFYRCDGSRPGGTAVPEPTDTVTPSPAATAQPICGNNIVEAGEQCDGNSVACSDLGCGSGVVTCNINCTFNTLACTIPCSP